MKKTLVCLLMLTLLCGCGVKGKVLVLHSQDSECTYLYDEYGNAYSYDSVADIAIPISKTLNQVPAMQLLDCERTFSLKYMDVGKYACDLRDVSAYVQTLVNDGYTLTPVYTNANMSEYTLSTNDISVRVIVSSDGYARVYALNSDNVGVLPPYTSEGSLDITNTTP